MNKEEGLKKIKFYDKCLWTSGISFISFILSIFIFILSIFILGAVGYESDFLVILWIILGFTFIISLGMIILGFTFIISLGIFTWGMIYHMFNGKYWAWFWITLLIGGPLFAILFYFDKMRGEFKEGRGFYEERLTKKEKAQLEYYQKHKAEIDKKENENFIRIIKWVGIWLGVVILIWIIKEKFF